ncbi:MAG: hypothetical protein Q9188_001941 [Gyalolechia gomerana]
MPRHAALRNPAPRYPRRHYASSSHANRETPEHKAARKARRRAVRAANRSPEPTAPGTNIPINLLRQSRRWLLTEHENLLCRFPHKAIREVENLVHINPAIRQATAEKGLSEEAKEVLEALETEREEARRKGIEGDWWLGERTKGFSTEFAKVLAEGRNLARASVTRLREAEIPLRHGSGLAYGEEEVRGPREPVLQGGWEEIWRPRELVIRGKEEEVRRPPEPVLEGSEEDGDNDEE